MSAPLSDDAIYDAACFCKVVAAVGAQFAPTTNDRDMKTWEARCPGWEETDIQLDSQTGRIHSRDRGTSATYC
jgi:hypothetical protein